MKRKVTYIEKGVDITYEATIDDDGDLEVDYTTATNVHIADTSVVELDGTSIDEWHEGV